MILGRNNGCPMGGIMWFHGSIKTELVQRMTTGICYRSAIMNIFLYQLVGELTVAVCLTKACRAAACGNYTEQSG